MKTTKRTLALRKLLDLCDDLHRLRSKMTDPGLRREAKARLKRQTKRKTDQLTRDLSAYRFRGPLGQLLREYRFSPSDFEVLAHLLHRSMRGEDPAMEGRQILAHLFQTSFEVLQGMELLHPGARLRASGLVVLDDDQEEIDDVLEARFRLSDEALEAFRGEVEGLVPADLSRRSAAPYASNREYLVDLRILHNLYKSRSERVFHYERWDRLHVSRRAPGRGLGRRIESFWNRIQSRLRVTPGASGFPAARFFRHFRLDPEEVVIVVHLLFKELYEGNAYADAAELLRMVSGDEEDLIRNRRLFAPASTLRQQEIVNIETMIETRELTGEVHLADWAVNALFGIHGADDRIRADERLEWHLYLKKLEDTGSFYRDLESN